MIQLDTIYNQDCMIGMKDIPDGSNKMVDEMVRLYVEEKYTLRRIGRIFNKDHHYVARRLTERGVEITNEGRSREPIREETRKLWSKIRTGRPSPNKGTKQPLYRRYQNMVNHVRWDVDLDFYMQFDDIEKVMALNKMVYRERVAPHFDTEKYKQFITKFYYDEGFNRQFEIYKQTQRKWDLPSLDHKIPLSRGGTWDIDNFQIISWFENWSKTNMTPEEYEARIRLYFGKQFRKSKAYFNEALRDLINTEEAMPISGK